jgi:predicted DNA binding protein
MKSYLIKLSAEAQIFHDYQEVKDGEPMVTAIHGIKPGTDEWLNMLFEYDGERPAVEARLDMLPKPLDYQLTESADNVFVYLTWQPRGIIQGLVDALYDFDILVDYPIKVNIQDELFVTLVGTDDAVRELLQTDFPVVTLEVIRKGPYKPQTEYLLSQLTPRQQDVLQTAVDLGYYDDPREADYEDIANEMDLSSGTVGYHIRNIETAIFSELVGRLGEE